MPNPPLIAVDTNVLIDLADENETAVDCLSTIRRKFPKAPIIVTPTVLVELTDIATDGDSESEKQSALNALRKIRATGLIPDEEVHDSFIIAESALANVTLLLSSDGHMKDINQSALGELLEHCDLGKLIIFSPAKIVKDFFNSVH